MNDGYGIERPARHVPGTLQPAARYLIIIDAGGASTALLFTAQREQVAEFDAASEEVALMIRGLQPERGATGAEWDAVLSGQSRDERAAARVFTLDV
jgi:hypothetical protein